MSYFTETFESIMEFKGDIPAAHATRRQYETGTGDHKYGKSSAARAKDAVNNNKHEMSGTKSGAAGYRDNVHNGKTIPKQMDDAREYRRKCAKESYDPVYEDLCRMGIM